MNKKVIAVALAILILGTIFFVIERGLSIWQMALGFILAWGLTLGFTNLRNTFVLFFMTLVLLVSGYLSIKYNWVGILPGAIAGCVTGILMHLGWIVPHKPFSRSEYVKSQER